MRVSRYLNIGFLLAFPSWRVLAEIEDGVAVKLAVQEGVSEGSISIIPRLSLDGVSVTLVSVNDEDSKDTVLLSTICF